MNSEALRSLLAASALDSKSVQDVLLAVAQPAERPMALAVLAKFCLPTASDELTRQLRTSICAWLSGTDSVDHQRAFEGLSSVFQVNGDLGAALLKDDGLKECLVDAVELYDSIQIRTKETRLVLARFLAIAASFRAAHQVLVEAKGLEWSQATFEQIAEQGTTRLAASVTVIKLSKAPVASALLDYLRVHAFEPSGQSLALEGLAVASIRPAVKVELAEQKAFLRELCASAAKLPLADADTGFDPSVELEYSIASILSHLAAYPPILSEEQRVQEKLAKLAVKDEGEPRIFEDKTTIDQRCSALIAAGAASALVRLAKSRSISVRATTSNALLSLAEQSQNRGVLLQAGASKVLLSRASAGKEVAFDLAAAQALAKLLITSNPSIALNSPSSLLDALSVLSRLLLHPEANALQHFEAIMALTNVSSLSQQLADRLSTSALVLDAIETYMLESHPPLRCRAATELACNLSGSPAAREKWANKRNAIIFLALARSGSEDEALSLAAAGALARLGGVLADVVLSDDDLTKKALELIVTGTSDALALRGLVFLGELAVARPANAKGLFAAVQAVVSDTSRPSEIKETAKQVLNAIDG